MSRIHDALKRAEQERATSMGTHDGPAYSQQPEVRDNMPSLHPSGATPMPTITSGLSYESLLARCPQTEWSPDPRTMLFFQEDDSRLGAEEFRTLRSRLYQIREKMPLKRLMVTSALPKEGKSFVAANLAQVMVRQHGRRALVIDADLRNPGLHRHLGAAQSPGLAEYLLGERVESMFDWIILDTSPVIPVSDATLVAGSCDGILMVVRSNSTPSDLARRAREEFPDKLLLGVVLNGAPSGKLAQSKYYYGEAVNSQA